MHYLARILLIGICIMQTLLLSAQNMKFYLTGGESYLLNVSYVDSIVFQKGSSYELMSSYYGDKVYLNSSLDKRYWFETQLLNWSSDMYYHQSMASYDSLLIALTDYGLSNHRVKGYIYDINKGAFLQEMPFSYGDNYKLHSNVCCFGKEFYEGGLIPLLYVSTWDYRSDRACLVYNIMRDDESGEFKSVLVQKITPKENVLDSKYIGKGSADWIVDTDNGCLYCLSYFLKGASTLIDGNKEMVTKFRLPKVSEGNEVFLTEDDVIDHFELDMFYKSQDKVYYDGKIFVIAGCGDYVENKRNMLYVLNLEKKEVVTKIDLYNIVYGEPEGLTVHDGSLIFTLAISDTNGRPKRPFRFVFH